MKRSKMGHIIIFLLLITSCAEHENIVPKPAISLSNEFASNWSGCLKGQAIGADPDLFHLAIYARINDFWYNLPRDNTPIVQISKDNQWICQLETLEIEMVSEMTIFLLPSTFNPPVLEGAKSIPAKLNLFSVAKRQIILQHSKS